MSCKVAPEQAFRAIIAFAASVQEKVKSAQGGT
jgi:hypothetical protein